MPSGPNKRKDAKKKKKTSTKTKNATKTNKKSLSLISAGPPHGERDGGQVSSPHPVVNPDKEEDNMSCQDSVKMARETQGKLDVDGVSSSQKDHEKNLNSSSSSDKKLRVKKKAATSEQATVADYLCQPIESSPEKGTQEVEDLAIRTPPIADEVKTVDEKVAAQLQLNKSTNLEKENDLVVPETPLRQTVFNENVLKNNPLLNQNEVQKLASEKDSPKPNTLLADSTNVKCPYCGKSSDDRVNELETPERSERQPLLASAPQVSQKSSWKSCCGIFELFSNGRN